jgi:hypothetical protein
MIPIQALGKEAALRPAPPLRDLPSPSRRLEPLFALFGFLS